MNSKLITQIPSVEPNEIQVAQIGRKYGMFIHFGINTFNNTEWSDGTLPVESYKPAAINAEQWIKTAHAAGMSYVILVTKHHDGFTLWDSKYTGYSVGSSTVKIDVVAEVAKACQKYGIQLGLYYSLWDRHEPCYQDDKKYVKYMKDQLTELLDGRYGSVVEMWFDGGWDKTNSRWGMGELYDHIKRLQPNCAVGVNHTIGIYDSISFPSDEFQPMNYMENSTMKYFPSDFRLWDPYFTRPGKDEDPKIYVHNGEKYYLPFEATICIRNMSNWFWDPEYTKDPTVTPAFIAEKYRHLTEQENVLIVNLAPNLEGEFEEYDRQTLFEAARMLGIARGEAVVKR